MKKLVVVLLMLVLLLTLSAVSFAEPEQNLNLPLYQTATVWMLQGDNWATPPSSSLGLHAKAFTSLPVSGRCCKEYWCDTITNHATITQWINYGYSGTRWDWQIRKPGVFATDSIYLHIQSNDDVEVDFDGFADLAPMIHKEAPAIPVWYCLTNKGIANPPADGWYSAAKLNDFKLKLPYNDVKNGVDYKIWNKIVVDPTTQACDYCDEGTITLKLTDVKYFINKCDGEYNGLLPWANPVK